MTILLNPFRFRAPTFVDQDDPRFTTYADPR